MQSKDAARRLHWLGLSVVTLLCATPVFPQNTEKILQWTNPPINHANLISATTKGLAQVDALEIVDISVSAKSVTIGKAFTAEDDWLQTLSFKIKNVSNNTITSVQINLFLPQIMPGGPQVPLCYGCGDTKGKVIAPGEVVEVKTVFYDWVKKVILMKSSLSSITQAEIHDLIVTLPDGTKWSSSCMKAADLKNACPKEH
jgi:hypothetical protein